MDRNEPPHAPSDNPNQHQNQPLSQPCLDPRPSIRLTGTDQTEHDALAELFLGDAAFAPPPMGAGPAVPSHTESRAEPHSEPRAEHRAQHRAKYQAEPRADRDPEPRSDPYTSRFDGNAARRYQPESDADLIPSRDESHHADPADERPVVELVILGHLPVRASLWVRQYACLSARKRSETIALVRAAGGSVAVDVITGRAAAQIEPVDSVEDAVTIATAAATRVVLRVDETAEPDLLGRAGVDEITILTGADEAAVVASYRLIKTLVATLDTRDQDDPDAVARGVGLEDGPRLRVAVMGNPGPEIETARQKIARACQAFLDRPIEILDASGRIDATGTVTVCRSDEPHATETVLKALLRPAAPAPRAHHTPAALRLTDASEPATSRSTPHPLPEVVVLARNPARQTSNPPALEPTIVAAPAPAEIAEPKPVRLNRPLASLIEGLTPIESRCPVAPGVELACDDDGRVHALTTDARGCGEATAALLAAAAWARDNLALLIRAEPGIAIPSADPHDDHEPILHLLARRPSAARAVLDTDVLVYALAEIDTTLIATPLNDQ